MSHKAITSGTPSEAPEMVFMMGLPAAGKSTVAQMAYAQTHAFYDCDSIKATHPDYDPANPQPLHNWSKKVLSEKMAEVFQNPHNAVYDSTGTDVVKMARLMKQARESEMSVTLKFVVVDLQTSLARNERRDRNVPVEIVVQKAAQIQNAYECLKAHADTVVEVENYYENPVLDDTLSTESKFMAEQHGFSDPYDLV